MVASAIEINAVGNGKQDLQVSPNVSGRTTESMNWSLKEPDSAQQRQESQDDNQ